MTSDDHVDYDARSATPRKRYRDWCYTINNWTEEEYESVIALPARYHVCAKEVGETGTPHLQGYIVFPNTKTFSAVKALMPRAYLGARRGTHEQASEYCKKPETDPSLIFESGELPASGKRTDLINFCADVQVSRPTTEDLLESTLYMRYPRHCEKVIDFYHPPKDIDTLDNIWIYGPTGCGKSRRVRDTFDSIYNKMLNKWFDNYADEETVLIEDIDPAHQFLGHFLKIWADHYPFRAEYKGGSRMIRPKRIIITSNYHPEQIWEDPGIVLPIKRRFGIWLMGCQQSGIPENE